MIVSTILVSNVLDVVDGGGGGGVGAPLVGISPAITVTDTSPVRAIANTKRFILSLLCDWRMQPWLYQKSEKLK
jgi:hypothetical protein